MVGEIVSHYYASKMSIRNFIAISSACILIIVIGSCESPPELTIKISGIDTAIKPIKVSLAELATHCKSYHGKYIETTGKFHAAIEQFAIYTDKNLLTGKIYGFWLEPGKDFIPSYPLNLSNGKRITIRGIVDITDRGHLGMYSASIKKINYWVVH